MKKVLLVLGVLFLVGCGKPGYKIYTIFEKENMVIEALDKHNAKVEAEIKEQVKKLKAAVKVNDEKAKKELQEWQAFYLLRDKKI